MRGASVTPLLQTIWCSVRACMCICERAHSITIIMCKCATLTTATKRKALHQLHVSCGLQRRPATR